MATTTKAERDRNEAIRAYGADHGWKLAARGPIPAALRSEYATAAAGIATETADSPRPPGGHPDPVVFGVPVLDDGEAGPGDSPDHAGAGEPDPTAAEQPPEPPHRSAGDRVRDIFTGRKDEQVRKPKGGGRRRPRVSLEDLAGAAWDGITAIIARLGGEQFTPVAACMSFEQPVAGMILDDAINGTVIDRPAQAIARFLESGTDAALLLGPPVVVGGVCAGLIPYPAGRAILGKMLRSWVIMAGPKIRQLAEREQVFAEEMAQMVMPGPDGEPVPATLDDIIDTIFTGLRLPGVTEDVMASANGSGGPG